MEKLAKKIASKISVSLNYDNEREQVITYGLIALIQITVTVLGVLVLGIIFKVPIEALIICFSVSILRKYSGGAHAGSIESCTVIAIIYSTVFAIISRFLLAPVISSFMLMMIAIAVFLVSFLIVYKKAPVDSPRKPIRSEQKRKRMRQGSFLILIIYLALSLIFCFLGNESVVFRSYCISLFFGVIWQIMTLTKLGFFILGITDIFSEAKTT